ncbi:restriction endonuclease [Citrobacter koseri]|uniref:restriction endonuclease n=1 Tax=Citrobacter koseri TaxID=545 RepID=UPI002B3F5968|nr:restriction endonuclease [Citrobacter koseri]MEB2704077.1 restriction endonuclease [Citrobacter koseri]MEB2709002.1 restriction endonuclease [Citrobacter koseri]
MIAVLPLLALVCVVALLLRKTKSVRARRHQRNRQMANRVLLKMPELKAGQQILYLRKINPYVFEEMILTAIERRGIPVRRNQRYSGDGGIDGQFWIGQERWLVQAKRFASAVRPEHVRQFGELARKEKCNGLFVHTGRTGFISSKHFSDYPEILLVSGSSLLDLLSGAPVEYILQPFNKRHYR